MSLKILSSKDYPPVFRATLNTEGNLEFSHVTAEYMNFRSGLSVTFFRDTNDNENPLILIFNYRSIRTYNDSFNIVWSDINNTFYVTTESIFNKLRIDYNKGPIDFYLERYNNEPLSYRLIRYKNNIVHRKKRNSM